MQKIVPIGILCLFACGGNPVEDTAALGAASQPLIGGRDSNAAQNLVGAIYKDGALTGNVVMLSSTLALTARQVAQDRIRRGTANLLDTECAEFGAIRTGLSVAVGGPELAALSPPIPVVRVITDGSPTSCQNNLAILELATPIPAGTPVARMRLDEGPRLNEPVNLVGWGYFRGEGILPQVRQVGDGTILLPAGGQFTLQSSQSISIEPAFALTSAASCSDDGGALLDANGELLAIVNQHLPQDASAIDPNDIRTQYLSCVGAFSVVTPVWLHTAFVEKTLLEYGIMPWRAGQDTPPRPVGGSCTQNRDCNSNLCIEVGGVPECSRPCTQDLDCGDSSSCVQVPEGAYCVTKVVDPPAPSNCQAGPLGAAAPAAPLLLMSGLLLLTRRRGFPDTTWSRRARRLLGGLL